MTSNHLPILMNNLKYFLFFPSDEMAILLAILIIRFYLQSSIPQILITSIPQILITLLVSSNSSCSFSVAGFVVGSPTPKPFSCYACVDLPSGETCNTTTVCPAGHVSIISTWLLICFTTFTKLNVGRSYTFSFV